MPALTAQEETAYFEACSDGDADAVARFLRKSPESLDMRNTDGWTGLFLAVQWARIEVVELLLAKGADMRIEDGNGRTALDQANQLNFESISDIFRRAAETREREAALAVHLAEVEKFTTGLENAITLPRLTLRLKK
jgi:ankyrin repeat protein